MISIRNLTVTIPYGFLHLRKKNIINNLSFDLTPHKTTILRGHNGSWKSTLIRTLLGLHKHQGQISFFDNQTYDESYTRIGHSLQPHPLVPLMTWYEHMRMRGANDKKTLWLLTHFAIDHARDTLIKNYSTGMKKRLSLAASLIHQPELLIRDEPLNGLDTQGMNIVYHTVKQQQARKTTILIASHLWQQEKNEIFL